MLRLERFGIMADGMVVFETQHKKMRAKGRLRREPACTLGSCPWERLLPWHPHPFRELRPENFLRHWALRNGPCYRTVAFIKLGPTPFDSNFTGREPTSIDGQ
jgi:hypothetical protein